MFSWRDGWSQQESAGGDEAMLVDVKSLPELLWTSHLACYWRGGGLFRFPGCFFKDVKRNQPILISNRISFGENTPH
jgi:hypothetical protein